MDQESTLTATHARSSVTAISAVTAGSTKYLDAGRHLMCCQGPATAVYPSPLGAQAVLASSTAG